MADGTGARRISPPGWWAMLLVTGIVAAVVLSLAMFNRTFTPPTVPVTLTADRSGLMLEPNSRVKMRGVQIGRVSAVTGGGCPPAHPAGHRPPRPDPTHPGQRRGTHPIHILVRGRSTSTLSTHPTPPARSGCPREQY